MTLPVGGLKITKSGLAAHPQNLGGFGVQSRTSRIGIDGTWCHGSVPTDRHQSVGRTDERLQRIKGARVHTHGQGRPRSPIRQRQCNYNCLRPALFYSIVYYIVLHTTIWTDTAPLSSTKPSVWRRTPVCADNAAGGCCLLDSGKRWNCV